MTGHPSLSGAERFPEKWDFQCKNWRTVQSKMNWTHYYPLATPGKGKRILPNATIKCKYIRILPNKTITQGKWSAQLVALIYNPVSSCYFRYSLPIFSHLLFPTKCPLIRSLLFCLLPTFLITLKLFLWAEFEIGSDIFYRLSSFIFV